MKKGGERKEEGPHEAAPTLWATFGLCQQWKEGGGREKRGGRWKKGGGGRERCRKVKGEERRREEEGLRGWMDEATVISIPSEVVF